VFVGPFFVLTHFGHYDVMWEFCPLVFSLPWLTTFTSLALLLLFLFPLNIFFSVDFCGAYGLALQLIGLITFWFASWFFSSH
jgi:hypothetical protein